MLSDEDFKQANVKATQTIDIRAFVDADEIPLEYYETPYYLAPGARGQKVYALLRETLEGDRPRRRRRGGAAHDAAPCRRDPQRTRAHAQPRHEPAVR